MANSLNSGNTIRWLLLMSLWKIVFSGDAMSSEIVVGHPYGMNPNNNANIVSQCVDGVKDFITSYSDAFKAMRSDHERCNMIRQKQRYYKEVTKSKLEEMGLDSKEIRSRLSQLSGGITFDEFLFLRKGKSDREKLISLVFYASFLPKMMPYMLMFNSANMLPDQFPKKPVSFGETKREALSRDRSHAALKMLMNLDRSSHVPQFSLNPFAGSKKRKQMEHYKNISIAISESLRQPDLNRHLPGPEYVMKQLERFLFLTEKPKAREMSLVTLPSVFTKGLANVISGNPNRPLEGVIPNFIDRTSVLAHMKTLSLSDDFLVNQEVDIESLSGKGLQEACSDRLIGTLGNSEDEMREKLSSWLRYAAVIPSRRIRKTGEYYNANLARSALLCYYAMDSLRNAPTSNCLPRLLLQQNYAIEESKTSK